MKKIIPVLGVLAGAAALAVYKMKKEEQNQIIDLDQGLLDDDDDALEEGPISDPASCCESIKETAEDFADTAKEKAKNLEERTEELLDDAKDVVEEGTKVFQIHIEDAKDAVEDTVENVLEEPVQEQGATDPYPHLNGSQVEEIRAQADAEIDELEKEGDVHSHERPVQHKVNFTNMEDLDAFKNTVINKGFVITNGDEAFQVMVLHITAINKEKLYENMFYLADVASACNGTYLGWTSKVVY